MDLDLDSQEGYFEQLRQMMVFGETWVNPDDNTIRYRPDEHPWPVLRPASGKSWTVQWLDEMAQAQAAEEERATVLRDVAARGLTPPKADDTPVTIRWACLKPTDPPTRVLYEGKYAVMKQGQVPGFDDFLRIWLEKR